jgi:hypothetical protein
MTLTSALLERGNPITTPRRGLGEWPILLSYLVQGLVVSISLLSLFVLGREQPS